MVEDSPTDVLITREALKDSKTSPARPVAKCWRAYELRADAYIAKPIGFESFVEMVGSISHFWFSVVTLPTT